MLYVFKAILILIGLEITVSSKNKINIVMINIMKILMKKKKYMDQSINKTSLRIILLKIQSISNFMGNVFLIYLEMIVKVPLINFIKYLSIKMLITANC